MGKEAGLPRTAFVMMLFLFVLKINLVKQVLETEVQRV